MSVQSFASRADKLIAELNYGEPGSWFPRPTALDEMEKADREIESDLAELRGLLAGPSVEELHELGRKVASGKLKPESARKRVESAASVKTSEYQSNIEAFLEGAQSQLMSKRDKAEWQYPALWSSCFGEIADFFVESTDQLIADWAKFPSEKKHEVSGFIRTSLLDNIDIEAVDTDEFDLRRQLIRDYEKISGSPDPETWIRDLLTLSPKPLPQGFTNYSVAALILCQDARLLGAGLTIENIILHELLDHFEPLRDPFGADRDELEHRAQEWHRVDGWVYYYEDMKGLIAQGTAGTFPRGYLTELRATEGRSSLSPLERIEKMKSEGEW